MCFSSPTEQLVLHTTLLISDSNVWTEHSPILTPPGERALLSPKTAFLLSVMWASSHTFSTLLPGQKAAIQLSNLEKTREAWLKSMHHRARQAIDGNNCNCITQYSKDRKSSSIHWFGGNN
jgi:hypothetical protein